tara:strand:- start:1487 stop:4195 length:2709 start_codon:yes stop_codon:yes gene_type:complete
MSNLLDRSSIVLTPTAYKNGEALCVKPDDGSGDFQFSRNSAATRVNAQGLVEDVQILSSNLVQNGSFSEQGAEEVTNGNFSQQGSQLITNGDFATDSDWTKGTGWSISGGSANCDGSQSGNADLIQGISTIAGKQYKISYTISNYSDGNIKVRLSSGNTTSTQSSNGTFTEIITAAISGGFRLRGNDTFIGSIDNCSVVEVGQNWNLGTGWSIGDNKASQDGSSTSFISQNGILVVGKTYKIQYTILDYVSGRVRFRANGVNGSSNNTNGVVTDFIVAGGTQFAIQGLDSFIGSITNISVKEVGQDWTLGTGWSIGDNKAIALNAAFGSQLIDSTTLTASKKYSISFNISNYVKGSVRIGVGNAFSSDVSSNGDYTFILTAVNTNAFKVQTRSGGSGTSLSITNISVIEITEDTNLPRINYEGFSYQDALGSELVTNGDFSNGTNNWQVEGFANITIGDFKGKTDVAKINILNTATASRIRQPFNYVNGKTYKVNIEVYVENGNFRADSPDSFVSGDFVSTSTLGSWQTLTANIIAIATGSNYIWLRSNVAISEFYISKISVKEVTGQEVVPDSGCGSWLWENQSTNLVTNSSQGEYGNAPGSEILATAPDGSNDAIRPVPNSNSDRYQYTIGGGSYATDSKLTYSWYKRRISTPVNDTYVGDLYPNVLVNCTQVGSTTQVQSVINNFDRFEAIFNITDGSLSTIVRMYFGPVIGVGNSSVAYWGHQLEAQSFSTSLIPTDGTSVTRNQDVCTNGGSLASINSTEGVLYAQIASLTNNDTSARYLGTSDGTSQNRVVILYYSAINKVRAIVSSGGTKFVDVNFAVTSLSDFHKVAIKYKANDFAFWVDGVEVATDTTGNAPIGLDRLSFNLANANDFFGKTKAVAVWKEALSDTELQELTTI